MQNFFFNNGQIKKTRKTFAKFLFSLIFISNFLPIFSVSTFAEGEESQIVENTPTIDTQATENQTEQGILPEQVRQQDANIVPQTIENTATTTATTTDTTTEDIGFLSTSTTTLGTTTEAHEENFRNIATSTSPTTDETTDQQTLINSTEGDGPLPNGTATIDTGDAAATANLLNIVNTNSINSTGTIQMVNLPEGHQGDLDFRPETNNISLGSCDVVNCGGVENISAKIQSNASIENALALQANSGDNAIATVGGGMINTGEAKTGLNLVNLANTNIIDSNYFVLTLNSFKDVDGDIILPSLTEFLSTISNFALENANINTLQNADIANNMNVQANAGGNSTENSLNSYTTTGNALSLTNIYNNINNNLFGGKTISILLKVTGSWLGQFLGLPDSVKMEKDGDLYTLRIDDGVVTALAPANLEFLGTSTAQIHNNIDMLSSSGNNKIKDTNEAFINTGNAVSAANVVNIANTNIVGKNWILAIINIFGDFNGNISFGRADISVEQKALPESVLQNDTILDYKILVKNKGDLKATFVRVVSQYDIPYLDIIDANQTYVFDEYGNLTFNLGELAPKEVKEIVFRMKVKNTVPGQELKSIATAYLQEKDNDLANNKNIFSINTYAPNFVGNFSNQQNIFPNENIFEDEIQKENFQISANNFLLVRANPETVLKDANQNSHQQIVLRNLSNKIIPNVTFHDVMYDQTGKELRRETWQLGDIKGKEEIELEYDVTFTKDANEGNYWFTSEVDYSPNQQIFFNNNGKIILQKENLSYFFVPATHTIVEQNIIKYKQKTETIKSLEDKEIQNQAQTNYLATNNLFDPGQVHYTIPLVISSIVSSLYMFTYRKREED